MLLELRIRDYAVVHDARFEGRPGLNVLSGETGAGKSIVMGALSLLLGERASSDSVRKGAKRSSVEAVFDIASTPAIRERLEELGLQGEDGLVVLRREVHIEGRNRAWVNGSPTTAATVGELGAMLVDLHGQNEHRTLLRPEEQRRALDAFAGAELLADRVRRSHREAEALSARAEELSARHRDLAAQADFLRFQSQEISDATLDADEEEQLGAENRRLRNAEELARGAGRLADDLYEGDSALAGTLSELTQIAHRLAEHDGELGDDALEMDDVTRRVEELGRRFGAYAGEIEFDEKRIEEVQARQDLLFRLKRKYGPELADVISTGERLIQELEEMREGDAELSEVLRRREEVRAELATLADELTVIRRASSTRLAEEVQSILPELGLEGATFEVSLSTLNENGPGGAEDVLFRASLNAGFALGPLARIASGGEVSRIVLILESILARVHRVPTLIFDEIDQGIGGRIATQVAERLRRVSEHHQVFVVTHLPQIASRAQHHLRVHKTTGSGMAETQISVLEGADRVEEIARMLSGDSASTVSRDHARSLIGSG